MKYLKIPLNDAEKIIDKLMYMKKITRDPNLLNDPIWKKEFIKKYANLTDLLTSYRVIEE